MDQVQEMEESESPVMSQDAEAVGQELATDDGIETRIDTSTVTDTSLDEVGHGPCRRY